VRRLLTSRHRRCAAACRVAAGPHVCRRPEVPPLQEYVEQLTEFFEKSPKTKSNILPNPYYWHVRPFARPPARPHTIHPSPPAAAAVGSSVLSVICAHARGHRSGNEEDLHAVFGFLYAGRPDLTQKCDTFARADRVASGADERVRARRYVRWALANKYTTLTDGVSGNDDYGTMSAWFVWNAMGLYPIACRCARATGRVCVRADTILFMLLWCAAVSWRWALRCLTASRCASRRAPSSR
jgi:hypothetical protein